MRLYHCDAVSENKLLNDLEVTSDEIRVEVDRFVISSKRVTLSTITLGHQGCEHLTWQRLKVCLIHTGILVS